MTAVLSVASDWSTLELEAAETTSQIELLLRNVTEWRSGPLADFRHPCFKVAKLPVPTKRPRSLPKIFSPASGLAASPGSRRVHGCVIANRGSAGGSVLWPHSHLSVR